MSRPKSPAPLKGPDGATPVGLMTLTGLVKTSKGFAVATAIIGPDGSTQVELGNSQTFKEFVAVEHRRAANAAAMKA